MERIVRNEQGEKRMINEEVRIKERTKDVFEEKRRMKFMGRTNRMKMRTKKRTQIQRINCFFHHLEKSFGKVYLLYDGPTASLDSFSGPIGEAIISFQ